MDEALSFLKTVVDDQDFVRLTKTVLRIIQNVLNDPEIENTKFRTVRAGCKVRYQFPGHHCVFVYIELLFLVCSICRRKGSHSYWKQLDSS